MLTKITNEIIFKNTNPFEIKFNLDEKNLNEVWEKAKEINKDIYNGEVIIVTNVLKEPLTLELSTTNFKTLLYAKKTNNIILHSLFSAIILKTKDNYFITTIDKTNKRNILGGMASIEDFENNIYNPYNCLKREVKEEINIDIDNSNLIKNISLKYLTNLDEINKSRSIGTIYIGKIDLTKEEMLKYFNENYDKCDKEIKQLMFYGKENINEVNEDNLGKDSYVIEILNELINNL